jgi:hypothetical protein
MTGRYSAVFALLTLALAAHPEPRLPPAQARKIIAQDAARVVQILKAGNAPELAAYAHPKKGIRFSPYAYVEPGEDVVLTAKQIAAEWASSRRRVWGSDENSGDPIRRTMREYFRRYVYNRDYAAAPKVGYNTILASGNTRDNCWEVYPGAIVVEYHFPQSRSPRAGHDWASLRLAFEKFGERWFLVGIIHDEWTM